MSATSSPQTVLGKCVHAQSNFSRFEPLLSCTAGRWNEVHDPNLTFPEVGKVFSLDPVTLNAEVGSFWLFRTETNARYEPGRGHDKLLAREATPAIQVIDCSGLALESARRDLVEVGLPSAGILTNEAIVCLKGGSCVRLKFIQDPATGRQRASVGGLDDIALMRWDSRGAAGATAAGAKFLLPGWEPRDIVDHLDWSPDTDFLERTLKRVRRIVRENGRGVDAISLSNRAIEMLTHYLRRTDPPSGDRYALHRMRRRLEEFLPNFKASLRDLEAIVASLEAYRPIAARITCDVEARRAELDAELRSSLEPVVRSELEAKHSDTIADLERVLKEVAAAETMRTDVQLQVDTLMRSASELQAALALELGSVHDALEDASTDAAGTVDAIVRRVSRALTDTSMALDLTPSATPPWGLGVKTEAARIGADRLRDRLEAEANDWGMESTDLVAFDALLRAGEFVVLVEQQDRFLLEAYARAVSGGRLRKLVVDPSMIGLDDLWRQAGSGAPTSFAKAWTAARAHADQTVLLTIEGLDVAPLELWLPALVTELHGLDRPPNLLVAGTLGATAPSHQEKRAALRTNTIPLSAATSKNAWMRWALRVAGREEREPATMLDASRLSLLSTEDTTNLIAELTRISGVRPLAAVRAIRVMQSASRTMDPENAIRLAVDVGRIASEDQSVPADVATHSVAKGVHALRDLPHRNES
jgi:hypothetical protein